MAWPLPLVLQLHEEDDVLVEEEDTDLGQMLLVLEVLAVGGWEEEVHLEVILEEEEDLEEDQVVLGLPHLRLD